MASATPTAPREMSLTAVGQTCRSRCATGADLRLVHRGVGHCRPPGGEGVTRGVDVTRQRQTRLSSPAIPDMHVPNLLKMKSFHGVLAGNTQEYSLKSHIGKVSLVSLIYSRMYFSWSSGDMFFLKRRRLTLALSRARKRERGTSGRWRASAAALCSAGDAPWAAGGCSLSRDPGPCLVPSAQFSTTRPCPRLLEHLIRPPEEQRRERQAKSFRRLQVDVQVEFVGPLHGQGGRRGTF
jgi:hypothetical protein